MDQFAESFFPATAGDTKASFWCSYDDKKLQAYSATMHFTGAVASIAASYFTQRQGRTRSAGLTVLEWASQVAQLSYCPDHLATSVATT